MSVQQICREEQVIAVKGMLLSNMLEYLGVSLDRYFRMTSSEDRACHISRCQGCARLRECVHMLMGEVIDPETFCPNCDALKRMT